MSDTPLPYGTNGANNRDAQGRFTAGNTAAAGHPRPFAKQAAALRRAFVEAVSPEDMAAIAKKLTAKAKGGDLVAMKLLLLWTLGQPDEPLWPDAVDHAAAAAGDEGPPSDAAFETQNSSASAAASFSSRRLPTAPAPRPEASGDYDTRKRAAMRQLVPLILAARAAEAAAQDALPPEASDLDPE